MQEFEKLGVFYLGKKRDLAANTTTDELVLYDSKHLTTHAVVVGMTGSGKTGLCIDLLEEAAMDGIPVLAIDPKGDIANLLLTFPELRPADFEPWVDPAEAERNGLSTAAQAEKTATTWRDGLASWGIDGARIARMRENVDVALYTPGSNAGLPLSILGSFDAPPPAVLGDEEALRERVASTVTGLLGLIGLEGDPMQSREHILLSNLIDRAWRAGKKVELPTLIGEVQTPPFEKVGVLDLESFFPSKDRFGLVMTLNNLVASPSFAAWSEGAPLDVSKLLMTEQGKPRISILSIAHLDDAQRMFFVTLLMNEVLAFTRQQSGTSSLRAIVYMDEIFGYFPPVANPPSKKPMLTLLKQARAFGVGLVLATQNPVDLDYKGLANTGTWFLGRLQTERDKMRVLEGLEGAAASQGKAFDRGALEQTLAGLGKRVFMMNDVNLPEPVVFETRWAMSYLRGPMTRTELKRWTDGRANVAASSSPAAPVVVAAGAAVVAAAPAIAATPSTSAADRVRPSLSPDVPQCFLPLRKPLPAGATLVYRPMLLGLARVAMSDAKAGVDVAESFALLTPITSDPVPVHWEAGHPIAVATNELTNQPAGEAEFVAPSPAASQVKKYGAWSKELATFLVSARRIELWKSPTTKLVSRPGEPEAAFRLRLGQAAREKRDANVEKLRQKYAPKVATIDERIRRAHAAVEREKAQAQESKITSAFSIGSAVLGALSGGKALSQANVRRVGSAARGARRTAKEGGDIATAEETVQALLASRQALEDEFRVEVAAIDAHAGAQEVLDPVVVKPKKAGISIALVTLAFAPYARTGPALAEPLFA